MAALPPPIDPQHSARQINRRLLMLLGQAFGLVVLLTLALLIGLVALVIGVARDEQFFSSTLAPALETYYLAHGSWEGVEQLTQDVPAIGRLGFADLWPSAVLLDGEGRVLIDRGHTDTPLVGQVHTIQASDVGVTLRVHGQSVGTLVVARPAGNGLWRLFLGLLGPLLIISFFTGLLTLVIGVLLARRVATPLADVIAAAQSVAAGDLAARVQVRGPGDLRSLSDSFNRMADTLERGDRERRDLLADVAHELRTPLTVMRGKLEGIVDGVYPADEAHVAPVLEETYVLERLVEDLRLLTLAETRQLHFDLQPINLGELAGRAASLFDAEAQEKRITLTVDVAPGLPTVNADPQRVGQVIGNLLGNALRYVPESGRVEIAVRPVETGVELVVTDNGPGMPEADLPHLFDRFWRGEKSRTRAAGGAGLGLAIARQLVEAQGGVITASNLPTRGLRVGFVLT